MPDVSEMTQTKPCDVTAEDVRTWVETHAIINTPFGTAEAFGAFYGEKPEDTFVGLTVIDPSVAPSPYPLSHFEDCRDPLQDIVIFYTPADGWTLTAS
jgi:hypothetical protein